MKGVDLGGYSFDHAMEKISQDLGLEPQKIKKTWINMFEINYPLLNKIKELKHYGRTVLLDNAPFGLIETIFKRTT